MSLFGSFGKPRTYVACLTSVDYEQPGIVDYILLVPIPNLIIVLHANIVTE